MTASSWPLVQIEWDADLRGVELTLKRPEQANTPYVFKLNTISVRELRDDMEEAAYLSRGYEKVECFAEEVQQYDRIRFGSELVTIDSVLKQLHGKTVQVVLQSHSDELEFVMPEDRELTVWRSVE